MQQLHKGLPIPPLPWLVGWLAYERKIVALYQKDRKSLQIISETDKARTVEAVRRIKELEVLIKTYYSSDLHASSPTAPPRNT